jgi:potassium efflux system protein
MPGATGCAFRGLCLPLLLLVVQPVFPAAPETGLESGATVTIETLKAKINEVEAATSLEEATRTSLIDLYRSAITFLEKAAASKSKAEDYRSARASAPGQAKTIREKLEKQRADPSEVTIGVTEKTPLTEVEQETLKEKANAAAVEAKLNGLEAQLAAEADRPNIIRQQLTKNKQRQGKIAIELQLPAPADQPPALIEAKRWALQSEAEALNAEIQELDQELLSQPMRIELLEAERDRNAYNLTRIRERVQTLESLLSSRRVAEAVQAQTEAAEAQRDARGEHPLIQELADRNAKLGEKLTDLAARLEQLTSEDDSVDREAERLSESLRNTRQRIELAGLSEALGQILLEQRRNLPDLATFRKKAHAREREISAAGLWLIDHEEERRRLRNIKEYIDGLTAQLPEDEVSLIRDQLEILTRNRLDLLVKASATTQSYLRALSELDYAYRNLLEKVEAYNVYLGERLLWVRSVPPPDIDMFQAVPGQLADLLSPVNWYEVTRTLLSRLVKSPLYLLILLVSIVLLARKRRIRGTIQECGRKTGKPSTDRFTYTLQALGLSLLLAVGWPLILWGTGFELGRALDVSDFTRSVSRALIWVAPAFYYLQSFRTICMPGGVAERHFRWDPTSLQLLRRQLIRLMLTFLPAGFIAVVVITQEAKILGGGTGRLAIVVVLLALALFSYRLFNPRSGALQSYLLSNPNTLLARLQYLWLFLSVATPLGLAVLAIIGYLYTAGTLTRSLIDSLWFILVLVIIHQLVVRWLLITRRRLAFQAAIERRQARAEEAAREAAGTESKGLAEQIEEPAIDLIALGQETRKLVNMTLAIIGVTGVWFLWADMLPALGILREFTLWHVTTVVAGQESPTPITLADAGLAILVAIITLIAARRFPAFLEIVLLHRLNITAGGRYTATTLSRYVIVATGAVIAISLLGGSWNQIQWLVAALGVGIGFGLQEIVANFICGLIILFERPIRVGDRVTVGDTSGVVSRIQIRATTILTWDRQELLVPNKEFITGRLLNWSLSDQVSRLVIPVGVAYGSDVPLAMNIIRQVAEDNEHVLDEPKPTVTFESFGDNSLLLTLRCFTDVLDYRLKTTSTLHEEINRRFNEAGIVIAFPQRDLHIDASQPLDIRIRHDRDEPGSSGNR